MPSPNPQPRQPCPIHPFPHVALEARQHLGAPWANILIHKPHAHSTADMYPPMTALECISWVLMTNEHGMEGGLGIDPMEAWLIAMGLPPLVGYGSGGYVNPRVVEMGSRCISDPGGGSGEAGGKRKRDDEDVRGVVGVMNGIDGDSETGERHGG